jgi:isopentenyldiphosphate isomerase
MSGGFEVAADDYDEQIEVVDEVGAVIGLAKRGVIHTNGMLHKAVHCFVFDSRQRMLLQQRSLRCSHTQCSTARGNCPGLKHMPSNETHWWQRCIKCDVGLEAQSFLYFGAKYLSATRRILCTQQPQVAWKTCSCLQNKVYFRKRIGAGLWDLSLAEHLSPGESYRSAALRGLGEELGISGHEIKLQGPLTPPFRRKLQVSLLHHQN